MNMKKEPIERLIIKVPLSVAEYFRSAFPHGQRSKFVAQCILDYKQKREIEEIENKLRKVQTKR